VKDKVVKKQDIVDKVVKGKGKFGEGTVVKTTSDGSTIERVDHAWQQKKGSSISSDGFHKEGSDTITMPKDIDITTPEGDRRAGEFVKEVRTAVHRGKKIAYDTLQSQKTGSVASRPISPKYKEGWERIFGGED